MYDLAESEPRGARRSPARRRAEIRDIRCCRHHAAITLLRHGCLAADIRDFFDQRVEGSTPTTLSRSSSHPCSTADDGWVDSWSRRSIGQRDGRQPFIISCPGLGRSRLPTNFVRYISARHSAFAEQPAAAGGALFGPYRDLHDRRDGKLPHRRPTVRASRGVRRRFACALPRRRQINYRQSMEAHYGHESRPYSERSLRPSTTHATASSPSCPAHTMWRLRRAGDGCVRELPGRGHASERRRVDAVLARATCAAASTPSDQLHCQMDGEVLRSTTGSLRRRRWRASDLLR